MPSTVDQPPTDKKPVSAPPVIPPAPPPNTRKRRQTAGDKRPLLWGLALVVGIGLGVACYRFVGPVRSYFDYWVARTLS